MLGIVTGGIYEEGPQPLSTHADQIFSEFQGLGAKWIRIEANWRNVQPATYQNIVRKAHDKGLKVIVLLNDTYCGDDRNSQSIDGFIGAYIGKLNNLIANVFAGVSVDAFEIANEPNNLQSDCPDRVQRFRIGGNTFAWLLRRVWEWKIANKRPELIISGGILNTYFENEPWWGDFFRSGAWKPGFRPFDYMGIHPYNPYSIDQNAVNRQEPKCFEPWKNTTKTLLSGLAAKINQLTSTTNTQLYVTEFGWQLPVGNACEPNKNCVSSPGQMAAGMQAAVEAFNESGVVPVALWYDYRDDDGRHGLRQQWDGQRYPARLEVWQKFKFLAGGTGSDDPESYWPTTPVLNLLYQLHNNGELWKYTGLPCSGSSCPGWQRLDTNSATVAIAAAGDLLYQLRRDGSIWQYTGTGWQQLDNNPNTVAIAATVNALYQLHRDGSIWQYTGQPCSGNSCPGWKRLDNNRATVAITAANNNLYQLHNNGKVWQYTGTPCSGDYCPGWQMLDNNPATVAIVAADNLYQLRNNGEIWRYTGTPCTKEGICSGWEMLDNNPNTVGIVAAGSNLYQLRNNGEIWRYTGTPCTKEGICSGWEMLDNNRATVAIAAAAAGNNLYQLHNNGEIWRYTGTPCSGGHCSGWEMLDNNRATVAISSKSYWPVRTVSST